GDLTSSISVSGNVDTSTVGTYTLTYTVADAASNNASTTRIVIVNPQPLIYFENGTCKCPNATVGDTANISATTYTVVDDSTIQGEVDNANVNLCTTLVTDMSELFANSQLNENIDFWDTSSVTTMRKMFFGSWIFNQDISDWDTSSVTDMREMFKYTESFNQDIGDWDTSGVTDMRGMFSNSYKFDQNLSNWDTSNVTDMREMFLSAQLFNGDVSEWDVSKVEYFMKMFSYSNFNQNIQNWNVSSALSMDDMFAYNEAFNIDIGSWNTSKVFSMGRMFHNAKSFNQDLSNWCVPLVVRMDVFAGRGGISFAVDSPLETRFYPRWGGCPNKEDVSEIQFDKQGDLIYLDQNGITIKAGKSAIIGNIYSLNGVEYKVVDGNELRKMIHNNEDISKVVTSFVTNFSELFVHFIQNNFPDNIVWTSNDDISSWDVSNVSNMEGVFRGAQNFNQDISYWDVSRVTNMMGMFNATGAFNQDLSSWCVSNISPFPYGNEEFGMSMDDMFAPNDSSLQQDNFPVWGTCPIVDNIAPNVVLSISVSSTTVSNNDSISITATFSEAMQATPTINISGGQITNVAMSATASSAIWTYNWTVSSTVSTQVRVTVAGSDLAGNQYTESDVVRINILNCHQASFSVIQRSVTSVATGTLNICVGEEIIFSAAPVSTGFTYEFTVDGVVVQTRSNQSTYTTTSLANNENVRVKVFSGPVSDTTACSDLSDPVAIEVSPQPTLTQIDGDPTPHFICLGDAIYPIVFALGGGATSVEVQNLAPGLTVSPSIGGTVTPSLYGNPNWYEVGGTATFTIIGSVNEPRSTFNELFTLRLVTTGSGCGTVTETYEIITYPNSIRPDFIRMNTNAVGAEVVSQTINGVNYWFNNTVCQDKLPAPITTPTD
ncbi:BspA family leucine-rich repeat surface protein, partial [Flavobacteriaceae bacterium]|nr:BspA family leucine-rich repeat surface protein [Flavobacteriaceae bacterium]